MPDWLIPDKLYDVLKWCGLVLLPALGVLVQTLGPVWGWSWADAAATTLDAIGLAVGVVIGASALNARRSTK
nr:phage holin [Bifidobacterium samirii]